MPRFACPFVCVKQAGRAPPAGAVSDVALLVSTVLHGVRYSSYGRGAVEAFVRQAAQAAHHLRLWIVKSELGKEREARQELCLRVHLEWMDL